MRLISHPVKTTDQNLWKNMTTIIVTYENNETDEHDFASEIRSISIGRRSTNDVCVPNLSVSGSHAKISISDTGSMIEDLSSTNGTYINGRLISRQLLNDGDDIVLGKVRLTFLQPEHTGAADQTPEQETEIDGEDDDEAPLTLAEKARLHQTIDRQSTSTGTPQSRGTNRAPEKVDDQDDDVDSAVLEDSATTTLLAPQKSRSSVTSPLKNGRAAPAPDKADIDDAEAEVVRPVTTPEIEEADVISGSSPETSSAVIEIRNGAKSGQVLPIDKPVTTLGRPGIQIAAIMKKPEGYFLLHIESDDQVEPPQLNNIAIGDEPVLLSSGDALNVAGIDVQFMQS